MRLRDLLVSLPEARCADRVDCSSDSVEVAGITCDSRLVQPGTLFVAYSGVAVDGHDYIAAALERGAAAVVSERTCPASSGVPCYLVRDGREALAYLHAAWQGFPARQLKMIGVTGTDGKTTVVSLVHEVLSAAGHRSGMVCTTGARIGQSAYDTGLHTTTPDAPEVQAYLAKMVAEGNEYAVLETTSHGLAQHRVSACDFDVAVVTNITHEHLDFHGSREAYASAKASLFEGLAAGYRKPHVPKVAVLNRDDDSYERLSGLSADEHWTYGFHAESRTRAVSVAYEAQGSRITVSVPDPQSCSSPRLFELNTPLVGEFNVYNCLAAVAVGMSQALSIEAIKDGIGAMQGVAGRMERIHEGQDFVAIVDFAHTPKALEEALKAARRLTLGRVIVVFGSAGLRDVQKRAWMGSVAARLADKVVITAEDPRTERLDLIMKEIARGCEAEGALEKSDFWRIDDRAQSIAFAVRLAGEGDVVIVAGKGHEQSMCFGTTEYAWSDSDALRSALRGERYRWDGPVADVES